MKWLWVALVVAVPLLFAVACSDDDIREAFGVPPEGLVDEAECMGGGLENAADVVDGMFAVLEAIDTGKDLIDPPEFAEFDCEADPQTFRAAIDIDDDPPDGIIDVGISGTIAEELGTNLCDGFDVGESFTANWDANIGPGVAPPVDGGGAAPLATGNGDFVISRTGAEEIRIEVNSATLIEGGCSFTITDMTLTFSLAAMDEGPPAGNIDFSTNGGALTGRITLDPNDDEFAQVSVTYDGETWNFKLDLDTFEPVFD